jgi:hypothetical protein
MATSDNRPSPALVILAGLVTTAAALAGVWWLDLHTDDFHIMGWYANYVLPVGAILVGVVAGLGYGVASWWTGLKIRRGLLAAVVLFQLAGWVSAEWVDYQSVAAAMSEAGEEPLGFASYIHLRTINFRWDNHGHPGEPLGLWGYAFVGLAVIGFVAGGLAIPAAMMFKPYCDDCVRYMRTQQWAVIPASAPPRKIRKNDTAAQEAFAQESAAVSAALQTKLDRVADLAGKQDGLTLRRELPSQTFGERRNVHKLPARVAINLVHCPGCRKCHFQPLFVTGQGNRVRSKKLEPMKAGPDMLRTLLG